jgi:multidrug efflux pump subunit AcrA (membrane-fusion protein)
MGEGLGSAIIEFVESAAQAEAALARLQVASLKLKPAEEAARQAAAWFGNGAGLYFTLCKRRAAVDILVDRLLPELPPLQTEVAAMLKSPQLRESLRKRTKPANVLLEEITSLLHEGGFSPARIGDLVDDGGDPAGAEARVRTRLAKLKISREIPAEDVG